MTAETGGATPWTILARLVRPQGRRGELLADILTDFPERFAERKRLFLVASETASEAVREVSLENHWLHKGRVVLKFAGVDSIEEANALRGLMAAVPASERVALTDGSIYIGDLIGCEVFDLNSGTVVGAIADVDRGAGLLEVKASAGNEILIPFVQAYLAKVDLAGRRIEMRLPDGLLEINAPLTDEERRELNASRKNE